MTSISSKNTPTMALKIDDRIPAPDRAVGLVQALVRQAQARGLCVQQHATREWGLADLETDICVHVLHGATLYHPKPWNLNVAVIPEDVAELPPNLPRCAVPRFRFHRGHGKPARADRTRTGRACGFARLFG
jgi:hypothetical protein